MSTPAVKPTSRLPYRGQRNLVPLPYRNVSMQPYEGAFSEKALIAHLLGREAYRRTEFIVLHDDADATAVVAIAKSNNEALFAEIVDVEVLALPDECAFARSPETDCSNRSALAELAHQRSVGSDRTLVVWGRYDHVNFIHRPDPLLVHIIEVAPPEPPKLYDLARHVLSYADLPPIRLELERIELRDLCSTVKAKAFLVPCRSGGLEDLGAPLYFLDERPAQREDWTLIGCERSLQFHRHYYGDEPPRIEMCPRAIAGERNQITLLKCCLLEFHTERQGNVAVVPWGADLGMVEQALRNLIESLDDNG
jgi:hypothetical protein